MKRSIQLNALILLCAFTFISFSSFGQLEVDGTPTAEALAASLVGDGVTISGVELDCADNAYGSFTCTDCNVGISDGILLTSGSITVAQGPNNSGSAGECPGTGGDADLEEYIDDITNDACVLEFDLTVTSDTLSFDYVFGSDEYLEFVGSFNDGFAFFISGPGITGLENIAIVPGSTDPVTINNVNTGSHSEFYVENGDGFTTPYSTDDYYIQYDGFTTVLTAKKAVIPCETYHLKMVVADALDCAYDSGVFIKGGSLSSPGVEVTYETELDAEPDLIEGCNNGNLLFDLSFAPVDTFEIILSVGGTATNGTDYSTIPSSIEFLPGMTTATIPIEVFSDGITEGLETIDITVESGGCVTGPGGELVINVHDSLPLVLVPRDTTICPGESVTLTADGALNYSWTPASTLSDPDEAETVATPTESTVYTVEATLGTCVNHESAAVNIAPPVADAGEDKDIIIPESATLDGSGGVSYSWTPTETLDDPNAQTPHASPEVTTTYTVTVTDEFGCTSTDEVTVYVSNTPVIFFPNAFSPNGDGINDFYTLIQRGVIANFTLDIYNRWGEKVFETSDSSVAWDGIYNGKEQPIGSYVFIFDAVDLDGIKYNQQGSFSLVR